MAKHTLRLHTNQPLDVGQAICLEAHHHRLKRVMRAAIGDNVRLFNGAEDADYWAKITHLDQHQARAHAPAEGERHLAEEHAPREGLRDVKGVLGAEGAQREGVARPPARVPHR